MSNQETYHPQKATQSQPKHEKSCAQQTRNYGSPSSPSVTYPQRSLPSQKVWADTPNTAQAAVPDTVVPPAQCWKTPAASNLPQADAAAFYSHSKQPDHDLEATTVATTRAAITSGNPDDAARGFSHDQIIARCFLVAAEGAFKTAQRRKRASKHKERSYIYAVALCEKLGVRP